MKTEHKVIIIVLLIVAILYFFSNKSENLDPPSSPSVSNEAIQMFNNAYKDSTGTGRFNNIITMGNIKTSSLNVGKDANGNYISSIDEAGNIITGGNIKSGSIDVSGNANFGNINAKNIISSGNIKIDASGNISTTGNIVSSGNIKIDASGNISTTGNISANKIIPVISNNVARYIQVGYDPINDTLTPNFVDPATNKIRGWTIAQIAVYDTNGKEISRNKNVTKIRGGPSLNDGLPSLIANQLVANKFDNYYQATDNNAHVLEIDLGQEFNISLIEIFSQFGTAQLLATGTFIKLLIDSPNKQDKITTRTINTGYWTDFVMNKSFILS